MTFYHCYNDIPETAEIEKDVAARLCCCFNAFATNANYSFPSAISLLVDFSVVKHFKLFILVLTIVINRIPHFFNTSKHSHIIKDQTEKRNPTHIFAFFVSHLSDIY